MKKKINILFLTSFKLRHFQRKPKFAIFCAKKHYVLKVVLCHKIYAFFIYILEKMAQRTTVNSREFWRPSKILLFGRLKEVGEMLRKVYRVNIEYGVYRVNITGLLNPVFGVVSKNFKLYTVLQIIENLI